MAYEGNFPLPVASGGTGVATITGVISGSTTSPFTASTLTQYNTLVAGASNAITNIAPGTATHVLTSNGVSSNPSYQALTGVNWIYITRADASNSATINLTSAISSSYNHYLLLIYNLYPATDNTTLQMNVSIDNGATWIALNYFSGCNDVAYNSSTFTNTNSTTTCLLTTGLTNSTANAPCGGAITFQGLGALQLFSYQGLLAYFESGGSITASQIGGTNSANLTVNALQFLMSAGNITTGTFVLYGMKES